jgi:hypothetical protein
VQRADFLPSDGKSYRKIGQYVVACSFDAIDAAAVAGYNVKAGDKISLANGFEITL